MANTGNNTTAGKDVYIRCPRCELNFILKKDKYCPVCKTEMQALSTNFADGADNDLGLCPICKVNYITEDETVCGTCIGETDLTDDELDALYGGVVVEKTEDDKGEDAGDDDELEMISLGEMEGEAEEPEPEDEEHSADPLDDFDDSLDDDDEDDEEEDYDEDFERYED